MRTPTPLVVPSKPPPYVNVVTYLVVFFLSASSGRWYTVHELTVEDMLYWGRFGVGVLSGTATILVTFFLGRKLFGTRVGLMGAALFAVFPGAPVEGKITGPTIRILRIPEE